MSPHCLLKAIIFLGEYTIKFNFYQYFYQIVKIKSLFFLGE